MDMSSDDPTLDDHRRAAALMALRSYGDPSSVVAFLSDPETAARGVQLLRAVDAAYRSAIADLRTELGVALLNGIVDDTVTHATEPRMKRAAQVIVAMRNQDRDAFTAVLHAANG
ncbi:hypothetical protein Mvan_4359 [Mycolicibacterium vanbaalenii PYR-1]|uniref:Uncharacterized protein n=2 Tax=Mycolicibacterium vanbaalenii TaxID=110539 RepID=A1TD86_MYCVP|nr:hypothetical protein Mvan_4359 [Mycolicibacterium vanbaalenii PYR-1]